MSAKHPKKRRKGLVVHALADETLVYDLDQDRALCLNRTAALVFSRCDGETSVSELAALVQKELQVQDGEPLVTLALEELAKAQLLEPGTPPPKRSRLIPRRQLLKQLQMAAALLPAVFSIVAPTAASAASYIAAASCTPAPAPGGCPNSNKINLKCLPLGPGQKYCRTAAVVPAPAPNQKPQGRRTCVCR
jgi:hypothetical protein